MANVKLAHLIYEQLGGKLFATLTGSKNFTSDDAGLLFEVARNDAHISKVQVSLNASGNYDMYFFKVKGDRWKTVCLHTDVIAEQLRYLFTKTTGLAVNL